MGARPVSLRLGRKKWIASGIGVDLPVPSPPLPSPPPFTPAAPPRAAPFMVIPRLCVDSRSSFRKDSGRAARGGGKYANPSGIESKIEFHLVPAGRCRHLGRSV